MRWRSPCIALLMAIAAAASWASPATPFTPDKPNAVLLRLESADTRGTTPARDWQAALRRHPQDETAALSLSRHWLLQARSAGDARYAGRALAALAGWPDPRQAPAEIAVQWATVQQYLHRFDAAGDVLEHVTVRAPQSAQAWLTLATVRRVQGRLAASQLACDGLAHTRQAAFYAAACSAENLGLMGPADEARTRLESLAGTPSASPEQRSWVMVTLAELVCREGRPAQAELWLRRALALTPDDHAARIALADLQLQAGRPGEMLNAMRSLPDSDAVLVRRAIASAAGAAARNNEAATAYRARLAQQLERVDATAGAQDVAERAGHAREHAMFALHVERDLPAALRWALLNVSLQREPIDILLLAQAARAAADPRGLAEARTLKAAMKLQDVRIERLLLN